MTAPDHMPSRADTATRRAIVAFLEGVTTKGGADVVPLPELVAVFDNDGTLWCEKPIADAGVEA